MSRHRDVRNMDYSEDYDGYDDVYGHSIDDDYYISPSNRQFIFNRENSRDQPKIGEFIRTEQDIQEEDESELAPDLTDVEKAKLESCIEQIKSTLSPLTIPRNELVNIIISHNFDPEQATNAILDDPKNSQNERKEKVPSIKVVASGGKTTTNVTKGFDLSQRDTARLNTTPRSQSPASGRGTPIIAQSEQVSEDSKVGKNKENRIDVETQYKKERGDSKEHLYMVVIGHVDAGKSTLMGHLLFDLGQVGGKFWNDFK
jgi:elongation factor 1 alpha-like protein